MWKVDLNVSIILYAPVLMLGNLNLSIMQYKFY
jgi:hypothetical protein